MMPPASYPYDYWDRQREAELARQAAEAQKAQRQRELEALSLQAQAQNRAMILNQAFVYPPSPSKNLSTQKVLKSIESLQGYLKQKPLYTTAQARLAVEC